MKTPIFAFTLSMIMCLGARAELKWEQTTIELHPAANDKQAVGHFKYQNTGKTPVHFKSVHASCGCTTAQSQKEEVPPGDKGEITATFNIGDRTGHSGQNRNGGDRRGHKSENGAHAQGGNPAATRDHPKFRVLETRRKTGHKDD